MPTPHAELLPLPPPPLLASPPETSTWSLRTSFALVVAAQVLLFAGSNLPTPLFPLYEHRYGFGSGTVTLLFGVYVGALVPTLLLLGPITDRIGRRPLLVAGIATTVLSSMAFAAARGLPWLFAGEIIYGFGGAMVMSCVAVAIRELHPRQLVATAALAASVAQAGGLALGPLAGGLLAWLTPWPTVAPYLLDIVLAAVLAVALTRIPETRPIVAGAPGRTPIIHVPTEIRAAFIGPAVAGATSFMAVGWVFGLSPSFLHEVLHVRITQPVVAGLFATLVVATNGACQLLLRRHHSLVATRLALAGLVAGMALIAASAVPGSLAVAVLGGLLIGAGSGVAQMNAMATIQQIAPVHARGGVISAYFTLCYLALSLPVIAAGLAADHAGLPAVTACYVAGLAVVAGTAVVLSRHAVPLVEEDEPDGELIMILPEPGAAMLPAAAG